MLAWFEHRRRLRELPGTIAAVARKSPDRPAFEAAAREAAARFGPRVIAALRKRLHKTAPAPAEFGFPNTSFGAWLSAWQFAIFEVLYNLREPAVGVVREIAFGGYDWTQGNAVEVLCRWAADGLHRERTVRELRRGIPAMRPEAIDYAVGPLLAQAESSPSLHRLIEELRSVPEFDQACRDASTPAAE